MYVGSLAALALSVICARSLLAVALDGGECYSFECLCRVGVAGEDDNLCVGDLSVGDSSGNVDGISAGGACSTSCVARLHSASHVVIVDVSVALLVYGA